MVLKEDVWSSRKYFISIILCQFMGTVIFNRVPGIALVQGALGYLLFMTTFFICIGIPLVYMEFIVGQFTQRDCIDVWKIRPFLSHFGYFHVIWQICILISNHTVTSFIVHYFLISFEKHIPYYTCGHWSKNDCDLYLYNFTVNQDCIKNQELYDYCENIYVTFPEYQYLRYNLIRSNNRDGYTVAWKVLLASTLVCIFVYGSCLKRKKSLKWSMNLLSLYSLISQLCFMLGSMRQKGIAIKYMDALGLNYEAFKSKFRLSNLILHMVGILAIGTGQIFNLASSTSFRCPCFSNTVISIVLLTVFSIFCIFTTAMMTCPYAYEYGVQPGSVLRMSMFLTFEKFPRLVKEYDHVRLYLLLMFSCNATLGLCTNTTIFYNLLELIDRRKCNWSNYPGLTCLGGTAVLFFVTIPFFSYEGLHLSLHFRIHVVLISTFVAMLECVVFVLWYGIPRFSEDVHFMLGIKPSSLMKLAWIFACGLLAYAFINELIYQVTHSVSYVAISTVIFLIVSCFVKLLMAVCKRQFSEVITLDPKWGPKSDVLQRSRAMFTAQAMTKEYMYRQYHLQAGIISRQRKSNVRNTK